MIIALAQIEAGQDRTRNIERGVEWIHAAAAKAASAICFPELSFLPFFPQAPGRRGYFEWAESIPGPTTDRLGEAARSAGIVVVANLYEQSDRDQFFNTAVLLESDGVLRGAYRMAHIAEGPGFHEKYYYWPGNSGYPIFETKLGKVGMAICHDRNFPEVFRCLALGGAFLVFVPTAFSKLAYRTGPHFLDVPQQAASMANGIFTVCVNRVGPGGCEALAAPSVPADKMTFCGGSMVTGPSGEVIARGAMEREDLVMATIEPAAVQSAREARPYFRDRRPESYSPIVSA